MQNVNLYEELKKYFNVEYENTFEDKCGAEIIIQKDDLLKVVKFLKEEKNFNFLRLISSVDYENYFEVVYNFLSLENKNTIVLKVKLDKKNPLIDSLTPYFNTANWLEREVYDLMGIEFKNHPELKRILLPLDWEGYPLRKDYVMEKSYHGIGK